MLVDVVALTLLFGHLSQEAFNLVLLKDLLTLVYLFSFICETVLYYKFVSGILLFLQLIIERIEMVPAF